MEQRVSVTVNGRVYERLVPIRMLLVDFLRDVLGLTATHVGCTYEGRCGACTVIVNGDAMKSCMMLAVQADGRNLLTAEGLEGMGGRPDELHPIQDAFWVKHGLQCGYCTPGMMMTIFDILKSHDYDGGADLSESEIRRSLIGNICRCTGYSHIVEAVQMAAERFKSMPAEERDAWFASKKIEDQFA